MIEKKYITEFEVASDLKALINYNPDVKFETVEIKNEILDADDDTLFLTKKTIDSPITFYEVKKATPEFINEYTK